MLGAEHEGVPAQALFLLFPQPDAGEVVRNLLAEQLRNHFEQAAQVELGDHRGRDLEQQARAVARAAQALLTFAHRGVGRPLVERGRHHFGERVHEAAFFLEERTLG